MKRILYIPLILTLFIFSCTSKKDRAEKYLNEINKQHNFVLNSLEALDDACIAYVPGLMDKSYIDAVHQIDSSLAKVKLLKGFEGEDDLSDDIEVLFDIYKSVLNNEYPIVIETLKKPKGVYNQIDDMLLMNIEARIFSRMSQAYKKFAEAITAFKVNYSISIENSIDPFYINNKEETVPENEVEDSSSIVSKRQEKKGSEL